MPDIPVECPECGRVFQKHMSKLTEHFNARCPSCGAEFHVDASDLVKKVNESLKEFSNKIRKIL